MRTICTICTICFLLALFAGCGPQIIVYAPEIELRQTPDLSGCIEIASSAGGGSAAVVAYRKPYWYAVTARHVVRSTDWILADGHHLARVDSYSMTRDLALLRFKSSKKYKIYPLVRAKLGQACWVVGWPHPGRVVNRGWVSRISRSALWHNAGGASGCSGGAVLSANGELLGVVTSFLVEPDMLSLFPNRFLFNSVGRAEASREIEYLLPS